MIDVKSLIKMEHKIWSISDLWGNPDIARKAREADSLIFKAILNI